MCMINEKLEKIQQTFSGLYNYEFIFFRILQAVYNFIVFKVL